jgi:rhodanese-related sulfurtransferase
MSGSLREIGPADLQRMVQSAAPPLLIDVRQPWEHEICRIEGDQIIPLDQLPSRLAGIPRERTIVLYCHHGARSLMAGRLLAQAGYDAISLAGGIAAWAERIDPGMARY